MQVSRKEVGVGLFQPRGSITIDGQRRCRNWRKRHDWSQARRDSGYDSWRPTAARRFARAEAARGRGLAALEEGRGKRPAAGTFAPSVAREP
jgi:hypothetical protein